MSALLDLARGGRPAGLLGTCRLEWQGGEAHGEEAVLALSRAAPLDLAGAISVEAAQGAAVFATGGALVADLYGGNIGRLWRLGPGPAPLAEPAVAVAFDPDLSQQRGDLHLSAGDHPELDPAALPALREAGLALVGAGEQPLFRVRVFAIRAFSAEGRHAALFAVHRLWDGPVRRAGFAYAAALVADGETRLVLDPAPIAEWTPRL